jgi:flagella synthesis protein FlgN
MSLSDQAHLPTPLETLASEQQENRRLLALLRSEQALLISAKIDGLTTIIEEKSTVVNAMTNLAMRRYQLLKQHGFSATEDGMHAWLTSPDVSEQTRQLWRDMLDTARAGKEINRTNGMLINKQMVHGQNALNILRGQTGAPSFYGPNGQTTTVGSSRGFVLG